MIDLAVRMMPRSPSLLNNRRSFNRRTDEIRGVLDSAKRALYDPD